MSVADDGRAGLQGTTQTGILSALSRIGRSRKAGLVVRRAVQVDGRDQTCERDGNDEDGYDGLSTT